MEKLITQDLTLSIQNKILLNHLTFTLAKDDSLALVGESGSGKTLFSRLLIGRRPHHAELSGSLTYGDVDLLKLREKEWQNIRGQKIAYIAQNPHGLFNEMQTIESHALELFQSVFSMKKEEAKKRFLKGLEDFNLENGEELLTKYPFQLSGGMLQRVMLAMMMELTPDILIADEPTSALDTWNSANVAELLRLCKKKGTKVIIITHDYRLLKDLVDVIIVLKKGEQIEMGRLADVLAHPQSEYGKELLAPRVYKRHTRKEADTWI